MKIENKEMKKAKTGAAFATFTIDGKKYNTFDEKLMSDFNTGDYVDIDLAEKNGYMNLVAMRKSTATDPETQNRPIQEARHDIIISRTEKPHSYEFGKPNSRHKVYYGEIADLIAHIEALKGAGLIDEEPKLE